MIIVRPITLTDATLDSSNVAENDHSEWDSGTTYAVDEYVIVTTPNVHMIYKSVQGSNLNNDPVTDDGTWWTAQGSTNRWSMFDESLQSQTSNPTSIVVEVTPGERVTAIVLMNCEGSTAQVVMDDPSEGEVYNETKEIIIPCRKSSWYVWMWDTAEQKSDIAFLNLPPYKAATITITITGTTAKCGACVMGKQQILGNSLWGSSAGITDYSVKETDSFGNFEIIAGAFSDRNNFDFVVSTNQVSAVKRALANYRATAIVYIGASDYEALITYGYFRDFDIIFSNLIESDVSVTVEGLASA